MAARISAAMQAALKLYDKRPPGTNVRDIAKQAGVSHTGLYAAIRTRRPVHPRVTSKMGEQND